MGERLNNGPDYTLRRPVDIHQPLTVIFHQNEDEVGGYFIQEDGGATKSRPQIVAKIHADVPTPVVTILEEDVELSKFSRPSHLVVSSHTDNDVGAPVEYDVDTDDEDFIAAVNLLCPPNPQERALTVDIMESYLDYFEKNYFFAKDHCKLPVKDVLVRRHFTARCAICDFADPEQSLLYCSYCGIQVHAACYHNLLYSKSLVTYKDPKHSKTKESSKSSHSPSHSSKSSKPPSKSSKRVHIKKEIQKDVEDAEPEEVQTKRSKTQTRSTSTPRTPPKPKRKTPDELSREAASYWLNRSVEINKSDAEEEDNDRSRSRPRTTRHSASKAIVTPSNDMQEDKEGDSTHNSRQRRSSKSTRTPVPKEDSHAPTDQSDLVEGEHVEDIVQAEEGEENDKMDIDQTSDAGETLEDSFQPPFVDNMTEDGWCCARCSFEDLSSKCELCGCTSGVLLPKTLQSFDMTAFNASLASLNSQFAEGTSGALLDSSVTESILSGDSSVDMASVNVLSSATPNIISSPTPRKQSLLKQPQQNNHNLTEIQEKATTITDPPPHPTSNFEELIAAYVAGTRSHRSNIKPVVSATARKLSKLQSIRRVSPLYRKMLKALRWFHPICAYSNPYAYLHTLDPATYSSIQDILQVDSNDDSDAYDDDSDDTTDYRSNNSKTTSSSTSTTGKPSSKISSTAHSKSSTSPTNTPSKKRKRADDSMEMENGPASPVRGSKSKAGPPKKKAKLEDSTFEEDTEHIEALALVSGPGGLIVTDLDGIKRKGHLWGSRCRLCNSRDGMCVSCSEPNCKRHFHAHCAEKFGLLIDRDNPVKFYCRLHSFPYPSKSLSSSHTINSNIRPIQSDSMDITPPSVDGNDSPPNHTPFPALPYDSDLFPLLEVLKEEERQALDTELLLHDYGVIYNKPIVLLPSQEALRTQYLKAAKAMSPATITAHLNPASVATVTPAAPAGVIATPGATSNGPSTVTAKLTPTSASHIAMHGVKLTATISTAPAATAAGHTKVTTLAVPLVKTTASTSSNASTTPVKTAMTPKATTTAKISTAPTPAKTTTGVATPKSPAKPATAAITTPSHTMPSSGVRALNSTHQTASVSSTSSIAGLKSAGPKLRATTAHAAHNAKAISSTGMGASARPAANAKPLPSFAQPRPLLTPSLNPLIKSWLFNFWLKKRIAIGHELIYRLRVLKRDEARKEEHEEALGTMEVKLQQYVRFRQHLERIRILVDLCKKREGLKKMKLDELRSLLELPGLLEHARNVAIATQKRGSRSKTAASAQKSSAGSILATPAIRSMPSSPTQNTAVPNPHAKPTVRTAGANSNAPLYSASSPMAQAALFSSPTVMAKNSSFASAPMDITPLPTSHAAHSPAIATRATRRTPMTAPLKKPSSHSDEDGHVDIESVSPRKSHGSVPTTTNAVLNHPITTSTTATTTAEARFTNGITSNPKVGTPASNYRHRRVGAQKSPNSQDENSFCVIN